MPRSKRRLSPDFPLHISARCLNKQWFDLPIDTVWSIFENHLYLGSKMYEVKIHAFVLMNNHYHLIASDPNLSLPKFMQFLQNKTSLEITRLSGRINQTFGQRYFSSVLESYHYFCLAYRYLYRNPVEAGLTTTVEKYPYSTLSGLLGQKHLLIPVEPDTLLFNGVEKNLQWLNTPYKPEEREIFRKALRHTRFKIPPHPTTRKPSRFETDLF